MTIQQERQWIKRQDEVQCGWLRTLHEYSKNWKGPLFYCCDTALWSKRLRKNKGKTNSLKNFRAVTLLWFAVSPSVTASTRQERGADTRRRASTPGLNTALGGQQRSSRTQLSASLYEEEKKKHRQSRTIPSPQGPFPDQSETAPHQQLQTSALSWNACSNPQCRFCTCTHAQGVSQQKNPPLLETEFHRLNLLIAN